MKFEVLRPIVVVAVVFLVIAIIRESSELGVESRSSELELAFPSEWKERSAGSTYRHFVEAGGVQWEVSWHELELSNKKPPPLETLMGAETISRVQNGIPWYKGWDGGFPKQDSTLVWLTSEGSASNEWQRIYWKRFDNRIYVIRTYVILKHTVDQPLAEGSHGNLVFRSSAQKELDDVFQPLTVAVRESRIGKEGK